MQLARDPERLRAEERELLYLHDQKTSGIPGVILLFVGMQVRATEKMCMGSESNIINLKHSSCEVIGWELQPGDEGKPSCGAERLFHYINSIFFVFLTLNGKLI